MSLLFFSAGVKTNPSNSWEELFVYFLTDVVLAPQAPETLPRLWWGIPASPELSVCELHPPGSPRLKSHRSLRAFLGVIPRDQTIFLDWGGAQQSADQECWMKVQNHPNWDADESLCPSLLRVSAPQQLLLNTEGYTNLSQLLLSIN